MCTLTRSAIFISAFLLLTIGCLLSQSKTDSIDFDDLHFRSEKENLIFNNSIELDDYFQLAYVVGNSKFDNNQYGSFKGGIADIVSQLESKNITSKKPAKQIKMIHQTVHDKYFKKYDYLINFCSIDFNGTYNCVTGTILFAEILKHLKIPYEIKETPNHVYLVTYPSAENIILESTDPVYGYRLYSEEYKLTFVKNLVERKIISEQEFQDSNTNALFDEYFFESKALNEKGLASIHYSNFGVSLMQKAEYVGAMEEFKKAFYLNPSESNKFNLINSVATYLNESDYRDEESLYIFENWVKLMPLGIDRKYVLGEFLRMSEAYLGKGLNTNTYDSLVSKLTREITDSTLQADINFYYHYEKGRIHLVRGNYDLAFPFVEKALQINPGELNAQQNYIAAIGSLIRRKENKGLYIESMETLLNSYPRLLENNNYRSLLSYGYLLNTINCFEVKDPTCALANLDKFEMNHTQGEGLLTDDEIGRAYGIGSTFYFRKGLDYKAKSILKRGLKYAPTSREIKARLAMF